MKAKDYDKASEKLNDLTEDFKAENEAQKKISYYSKLKPYEDLILKWHRSRSIGRSPEVRIKVMELMDIYSEEYGVKLDKGCNSCVSNTLNRIGNYYTTTKEYYKNRRAGNA